MEYRPLRIPMVIDPAMAGDLTQDSDQDQILTGLPVATALTYA